MVQRPGLEWETGQLKRHLKRLRHDSRVMQIIDKYIQRIALILSASIPGPKLKVSNIRALDEICSYMPIQPHPPFVHMHSQVLRLLVPCSATASVFIIALVRLTFSAALTSTLYLRQHKSESLARKCVGPAAVGQDADQFNRDFSFAIQTTRLLLEKTIRWLGSDRPNAKFSYRAYWTTRELTSTKPF